VLVHHVERPRVRVETLKALLAALTREPEGIWQATHQGRSGHPIVWPRALFDELLALDPSHASARVLLRGSAAARRRKLDVDDLGVLDNFDTPDDLEQLRE
jgi:CTP:molybdopterin cytidylyltransferase MocA